MGSIRHSDGHWKKPRLPDQNRKRKSSLEKQALPEKNQMKFSLEGKGERCEMHDHDPTPEKKERILNRGGVWYYG